jgi:amphi-Trp domain-containing protein
MATIDEFKHESLQDSASIAKYLEALREAFETGMLELSDERGHLMLQPKGLLGLEVYAKKKGGHVKIRLKFTWREDRPEQKSGALKIHSE